MCEIKGSRQASVDLPLIEGRAAPLLAEEIADDGMPLASAPRGSVCFSTSLPLLKYRNRAVLPAVGCLATLRMMFWCEYRQIFAERNFRHSVLIREKRENYAPRKLGAIRHNIIVVRASPSPTEDHVISCYTSLNCAAGQG